MAIAEASALVAGTWRPLRLGTLVGLRWLAIVGQTIGVLFVYFGLGYPLPLTECLMLISLSVLLNLYLVFQLGEGYRPTPTVRDGAPGLGPEPARGAAGAHRRAAEPVLAAARWRRFRYRRRRCRSARRPSSRASPSALASLLAIYHYDLPWDPDSRIVFDRVYVIGIWVSIVCGTIFIAAYTNRVAHEARQLADALAATELALSRHEQLSALDGLAAAAAHELGTPLSTIALVAREMRDELPAGDVRDDAELIMSQAKRCREILGKLRSLRETRATRLRR